MPPPSALRGQCVRACLAGQRRLRREYSMPSMETRKESEVNVSQWVDSLLLTLQRTELEEDAPRAEDTPKPDQRLSAGELSEDDDTSLLNRSQQAIETLLSRDPGAEQTPSALTREQTDQEELERIWAASDALHSGDEAEDPLAVPAWNHPSLRRSITVASLAEAFAPVLGGHIAGIGEGDPVAARIIRSGDPTTLRVLMERITEASKQEADRSKSEKKRGKPGQPAPKLVLSSLVTKEAQSKRPVDDLGSADRDREEVPTEDTTLACASVEGIAALVARHAVSGLAAGAAAPGNTAIKNAKRADTRDPLHRKYFTLPAEKHAAAGAAAAVPAAAPGRAGLAEVPHDACESPQFVALCSALVQEHTRRHSWDAFVGRAAGGGGGGGEELVFTMRDESYTLRAASGQLRSAVQLVEGEHGVEVYYRLLTGKPLTNKVLLNGALRRRTQSTRNQSCWTRAHCKALALQLAIRHEVDDAATEAARVGPRAYFEQHVAAEVAAAVARCDLPETAVPVVLQSVQRAALFARETGRHPDDAYCRVKSLLKVIARHLQEQEQAVALKHPPVNAKKKDRTSIFQKLMDAINVERSTAAPVQHRHYVAAGTIVELFTRVSLADARPFTLCTLDEVTHGSVPKSVVALRGDTTVIGHLSHSKSKTFLVSDFPPMLCPPCSWSDTRPNPSGGGRKLRSPYRTLMAEMVRPSERTAWLTRGLVSCTWPALTLSPLVTSLNFIGRVEWRLSNVAVHHLQWVKRSGADFGDSLKGDWVPEPPPPPLYHTRKAQIRHMYQAEAHVVKATQRRSAIETSAKMSQLMDKFSNRTLHLPCNVDFRGRAYPMHAGLNYQASDSVRTLLEFKNKKPLGVRGLYHLKIHAANLMGRDKASFDERIAFCDENIEKIVDSKNRPHAPDAFWRSADKPLLGYTVLCELANAFEHSRGPAFYETSTPIHVDGSCNGLQHYSAMSLDPKGAATANLSKKATNEKPSDVYTTVLDQVKVLNLEIIEGGGNDALLAERVHSQLKRKTVKQSVMTNVYGVTQSGMREQVRSQLVSQMQDDINPPTIAELKQMSAHVVKLIDKSLSNVFKGAIEVQRWFS
eukprot:gene8361-12892_t